VATLDELVVRIDASTELLRRELKKGEQGVDKFRRTNDRHLNRINQRYSALGSTIKRAMAGFVAALSVRALTQFARSAIAAGDNIAKASATAGIAAENLQELRFAFSQLAGTTDKEVDESIRRFNRRLGLAIQGMGEAKATFELMGVGFRDGSDNIRQTDDVLNEVLGKLAAIESDSVRAARASQVFGEDAGPRLAAALGQGIDAMQALRDEVPGVISNENVKIAEQLTDQFDVMARTVGGRLTNSFIEAAAKLGDLLGLIELDPETQKLLQIRDQRQLISNLETADALGSLGGNIILLERAREQLAAYQRELRAIQLVTPFGERATRNRAAGGGSGDARANQLAAFGDFSGNFMSEMGALEAEETARLKARQDAHIEMVNRLFDELDLKTEESTEKLTGKWETIGQSMNFSIRNAMSNAFLGIEQDFGDTIRRMIADWVAQQALIGIASSFTGGGGFANFMQGVAGARAHGGPVSGGRSYLVGERGPEIFTPNMSGQIAANGSGGGVSIVNQIDARGADPSTMSRLQVALDQRDRQLIAQVADMRSRGQI